MACSLLMKPRASCRVGNSSLMCGGPVGTTRPPLARHKEDTRMDTWTLPTSPQDRDAFEISPALEESSPTPLSTHWIPLHELIAYWTAVDTLLLPAPVAPLLTAIGHALFALSRETRALRLYTLAWQKQRWHAPH